MSVSTVNKSMSRYTSDHRLLHYNDKIATAMVSIASETTCGNHSYPCEKCHQVAGYDGHGQSSMTCSPDLGISAINCTHHTGDNWSGYTGPLTSTVVHSPQYTETPECLRHCELSTMGVQPGWSQDNDFCLLQRCEPSGCDVTERILRGKRRSYGSNNCSVPSAPPCSFTSNTSQSVHKIPYNSPDSSLPQTVLYPSAELLGPRPECDGQEFSPAKMARKNRYTLKRPQPSPLKSHISYPTLTNSWKSHHTSASRDELECTTECHTDEPELTALHDVSDVASIVGKRMCCIGKPNGRKKSFNQKSIGQKLRHFTKSFGQAGKSSKSSLQTLTVL